MRSWRSCGQTGSRSTPQCIREASDLFRSIGAANNGQLGKISKEQRAGNWDVWQTSLHNPSFAAYAEISGAPGIRVEDKADLDLV